MAVTRARVFFLFAASIVTIAALYLFPDRMIAPGKLKDAHTGFGKDCFACHELFHGAKSKKCQSCHAIDPHGSMTTVGVMRRDDARAMPFHQALTEKNCLGCHSDHEGMKAYRAPVSFSHQLLAPEVSISHDLFAKRVSTYADHAKGKRQCPLPLPVQNGPRPSVLGSKA